MIGRFGLMGIKTRIDYILSSNSFFTQETSPVNSLDLGSDHTAVRLLALAQNQERGII